MLHAFRPAGVTSAISFDPSSDVHPDLSSHDDLNTNYYRHHHRRHPAAQQDGSGSSGGGLSRPAARPPRRRPLRRLPGHGLGWPPRPAGRLAAQPARPPRPQAGCALHLSRHGVARRHLRRRRLLPLLRLARRRPGPQPAPSQPQQAARQHWCRLQQTDTATRQGRGCKIYCYIDAVVLDPRRQQPVAGGSRGTGYGRDRRAGGREHQPDVQPVAGAGGAAEDLSDPRGGGRARGRRRTTAPEGKDPHAPAVARSTYVEGVFT